MRVLLLAVIGALAGCAAPEAPPVVALNTWVTSTGAAFSRGELQALREGCGNPGSRAPRSESAPADPTRSNPAYYPGGEGLANAAPIGLAAPDQPIVLFPIKKREAAPASIDECLAQTGLRRPM